MYFIFLEPEKRLEDFIIDFAILIRNSSEKEYNKSYNVEIKNKYQNYFNKIRGKAPLKPPQSPDLPKPAT